MDGEFAKHQIDSGHDHLSAVNAAERERLSEAALKLGYRLGCQARVGGDLVVDVPPESQTQQQVVRKAATHIAIQAAPAVRLVMTEVAEPVLESPGGDLQRLLDAVEFETGLEGLTVDPTVLRRLQPALREGRWQVTVAVHEAARVIAIWPGRVQTVYGVAVDIGSTTIAGHLCELHSGKVLASAGLMNPQIRFGEDLMSRVSYSMMNPGGDLEMTHAVRDGVNDLIDQLLADTGVARDAVLDSVFVCNPVMHHLFLGLDPVELGGAPFALATQQAFECAARDLAVRLAPGARSYLLPCIAGHVGADAAAVTLAQSPYQQDEVTLVIDVGTNVTSSC